MGQVQHLGGRHQAETLHAHSGSLGESPKWKEQQVQKPEDRKGYDSEELSALQNCWSLEYIGAGG